MKLIALFILSLSFQSHAQIFSIEKLNKDLKKANAGWVAQDNWLNHLSSRELKKMMGAKGVRPSSVDFSNQMTSAVPEVIDWRDRNGVNYVSPVLNQGSCGSCVAFAAVATLETQMNISSGLPFLNNRYSPEALFACGGGACESGWYPSSAASYMQRTGVPDEACAPYTMGATGKDVSCSSICRDSSARAQRISSSSSPRTMAEVKEALKKGPMMTTMTVYADFISYSSGVYKHTTGSALGGHAISLIGFDDNKRAWIIRNSWSTAWGINGFAYVSYDDKSGVAQSNNLLNLPATTDLLFTDFRDRRFFSGDVVLKVQSNFQTEKNISVSVTSDEGKVIETNSCSAKECSLSLRTNNLPDGKYELIAKSDAAQLHRYFYISNQAQKFNLDVKPQNFNAAGPVKDRIVVDVNISHEGKVPLQQIALVYQTVDGFTKERWTETVSDQMEIGWRTNMVPNGKYRVWIRAQVFVGGEAQMIDSPAWEFEVKN
jgi:C1A family cysteine protease